MVNLLLQLALLFGGFSFLAVGGANAILPAIQHAVVDSRAWMTEREFLDLFAVSRLAPGPGSLIVTLVGQRVAGVPGALVATASMYVPSCLLVYGMARAWGRWRGASWREMAEAGLAPVAVGLSYAAGLVLLRGTVHDPRSAAITALAAAVLAATRLHPLLVLGAGAAAGALLGL